MGDRDYVKGVLEARGTVHFGKVRRGEGEGERERERKERGDRCPPRQRVFITTPSP
jgi:hypothetical protein